MNRYVAQVLKDLSRRCVHEREFLQAAEEVLPSLSAVFDRHPAFEKAALLERFVEPERSVIFRIPWTDDAGKSWVNRGYRVQFSSAIGPYKGGMRFHPTVTLSIMKFLGLEQVLKNSLTGLPLGGAKGGSDFNPAGKSDGEVQRFCQSLMTELFRHIGSDVDVPAGDIGVGAREVGFMYGQYKRITGVYEGAMTGKGLSYGGSLVRKEATGYGLCYLTEAMLARHGRSMDGMRVLVSGSGNVAMYAAEKAEECGAKVLAMSDSDGFILDEEGIRLDEIKKIKEKERGRISEYTKRVQGSRYVQGSSSIWSIPCDLALPCATQNELDEEDARLLADHGVVAVAEGANMPVRPKAIALLKARGVLFAPGKAANAGGVAVSALEMSQNATRLAWSFEEVDGKLREIMERIFRRISDAAENYTTEADYAAGANIAGFLKVAEAMMSQGLV